MQLRSFVLADAVLMAPDGKAMIMGAGIDRINAWQFPWTHAQLVAYVRVETDDEEPGSAHDFEAQIVGSDHSVVIRIAAPFTVGPRDDLGLAFVNFAPTFQQVQFPAPGRYWVRFLADRNEMARFPLDVVEVPHPPQEWRSVPGAGDAGGGDPES